MNKFGTKEEEKQEARTQYCLGKLFFSLLIMLFFCHTASSQVKVSVLVSPQFNESFGVRVGTDLKIPFNSRWSFVPGLYWSLRNRNSDQSSESGESNGEIYKTTYDFHDRAHMLTLPLRMGVRLAGKPDGNFALQLLFGPYIAYGIDGTSECNMVKNGVEKQTKIGAFDTNGRYCSRWDYGINCGLNVLLKKHFVLGIFTEIGCRKIYNSNGVLEEILGEIFIVNKINMAAGLTLGYQF
ncbi:MAG: porin family protein [Bacteroidales bacterium]